MRLRRALLIPNFLLSENSADDEQDECEVQSRNADGLESRDQASAVCILLTAGCAATLLLAAVEETDEASLIVGVKGGRVMVFNILFSSKNLLFDRL